MGKSGRIRGLGMQAAVSGAGRGAGRMRAWWLSLLAAIPIGAAAFSLEGFAGTWVRDARERDDAARDAVIVRATEPMSFAFRGFARGVMRKRMVPVERYVVEQSGRTPQISNEQGVVLPLDGRTQVPGGDSEVARHLAEPGEI